LVPTREKKLNVCVIPARGGSKRIPRKNLKKFNGEPIISYSIKTAIDSNCFSRVIVSTDDDEISEISRHYGAEVPFIRPKELSDDYTGTTSVIKHAIEFLQNEGGNIDLVCCIYATAPFIQTNDIIQSLSQIESQAIDYCFSVTSYPFPIQRAIRITKNKRCEMLQPDMLNQRSQDLEEVYHDAGQFYWGRANSWLKDKPIFGGLSSPYILPRYRVQDIDTEEDWVRAEIMCKSLQES